MSTLIMGQVWLMQMTPTEKAVLISLADQANDEGYCFPSVEYMEKRVCLSERAIRGALTRLEQSGVLQRHMRDGKSTMYRVTPALFRGEIWSREQPLTGATGAGVQRVQGCTPCRGGVQQVQGRGARGAPITVIEPLLNQNTLALPPSPAASEPAAKVKPRPAQDDPGFAAFWQAYPKKKAKLRALKAWGKLCPDADLLAAILQNVAEQRKSADWTKDDGRYVPHPETYLNGGCWEDETAGGVSASEAWAGAV